MKRKPMVYLAVVLIAILAVVGWRYSARSAYETAKYEVLQSEGQFEVRRYPDLTLASTEMSFDSQGNDGSFMRLFGYISGRNESDQKIAMTTPVFMDRENDSGRGEMGFVVPEEVVDQGVPQPNAGDVRIATRAGGRFAVIRFSGRIGQKIVDSRESELRTWMEQQGLVASSEARAEVAGYDAPWIPGPFRRNEVLIRLQP